MRVRAVIRRSLGAVVITAGVAHALTTSAADRTVQCKIEVNGKVYLEGPCNFTPSPLKDGSFDIGTGETEKDRSPYFASVNKSPDGTAEAFWNETPAASHAQASLGIVHRVGACWVNDRAQICAK